MPNAGFDYELVPEGVDYLAELALDLRNTWDHGTDDIWKKLDPELWAVTHNP
jgi:glycogen phosphorylase